MRYTSPDRTPRSAALLIFLLAMIAGAFPGAPGAAAAESEPAVWAVTVRAIARGYLYDPQTRTTTRRLITLNASATVRPAGPGGALEPAALRYSLTDEREERDPSGVRTHRILDPERYNGATDIWASETFFKASPRPDGRPALWGGLFTGELQRLLFTYESISRSADGEVEVQTAPATAYFPLLPLQLSDDLGAIPGNADGSVFTLDTAYTAREGGDFGMPLQVQFFGQVRKVGGCLGKAAPIAATDPVLEGRDLELSLSTATPEILPSGEATITASLTCDGVPVSGARLQIGAIVTPHSGGHLHIEGRPYGYVNGVRVTPETRLDATRVTTGADGRASFTFRPGRDALNEQIGIAGRYRVFATYGVTAGYELFGTRDSLAIKVLVPGLVELPAGDDLQADPASITPEHPRSHFGTPATIARLQAMARDYKLYQGLMNIERSLNGQAEWPVLPLLVNDISLPWGGLFDVRGWDVEAGRVRGAPWQPPHYTHTDGTVVDFTLRGAIEEKFAPSQRAEAYNTLRALLRSIGRRHGGWLAGPTLTLRATQSAPSMLAQGGPDVGASAVIGIAAADPAAGAPSLLGDPSPVVAPGGQHTLVLAADNLAGASAAPATLSLALPAGLSLVGASAAPSSAAPGAVSWDLGELGAGALPEPIRVTVAVGGGVAPGTRLPVTVTASGAGDSNPANDSDSLELIVRGPGADLSVSSDLGHVAHSPDAPVRFTITAENHGASAAQAPELRLTLPLSATLDDATPGFTQTGRELRWALGALPESSSRSVTATVALDPSLSAALGDEAAATSLSYAVGAGAANETAPGDNERTITRAVGRPGLDLDLELDVSGTPAIGQELTYRITYGNSGSAPAADAVVTLGIGAGLELIGATPAVSDQSQHEYLPGGDLSWLLGITEPGEEGVIVARLRVKSLPPGGLQAVASIGAAAPDVRMSNNSAADVRGALPTRAGGFRLHLPLLRR